MYSVCVNIYMLQNVYSLKARFPLLATCFLLFSNLKTKRNQISKAVGSRIVILLTGGRLVSLIFPFGNHKALKFKDCRK